ncbi:MAG: DegT/DnrJ/EryC1/StrS family aminotransferase [Planctomycetales bacterium]|nr:DegT/DnrJ/EryC1/StrS family aminotransferase [Planctomycetales bacterium]
MPESIPLVNLKAQSQRLKGDLLQVFSDVIDSAGYILGKEVELFESEFAEYCGAAHCVGVANGTEALHLALRACGVGPGDEVITAGNSFAATPFAIAYCGATPVFVDVDPVDFNLDPNLVEDAVTPRTRAIVPVHLYGQPAKVHDLRDIAQRHGLRIVEDAAQAHGAELSGQRCGSLGDAAGFSFYPGKNLGALGDGGAVTTSDPEIAERIALLRNYGQRVKNQHDLLGYNCRLDTLQAAALLVKLAHLEAWTEQRRRVAAWYRERLADAPLALPAERQDARHVYHLFVARHPERDRLLDGLRAQGVFGGVHYPHPLHLAAPFQQCKTFPHNLPITSRLAAEIFSLPMCGELDEAGVDRVCDVLKQSLSCLTEGAVA